MTQYFNTAKILGYHPGNDGSGESASDYSIEDRVMSVDISARSNEYKGNGKIELNNSGEFKDTGNYLSQIVRTGDRVEFRVGGESQKGYGEGGYGAGAYSGGMSPRWMGFARPYDIDDLSADNSTLTLTTEQFAPAIMSVRRVRGEFDGQKIVGSGGIINEILTDKCPELDLSRLPDRPETTTIERNGEWVLQTIAQLAVRLDMLLCFDGRFVQLADPQAVAVEFEAQRGVDVGEIKTNVNDDNLVNDIRVEGGTGRDPEDQSSQTNVDGYTTVTQSDRLTYQIDTRKDELARLEIWTRHTGSGENFVVRLQQDANGAPFAPADNKSDIVQKKLDPTFVTDDGWTEFILPNHDLPDPFPWLIIQSEGPSGQEIGIDTASGDPGIIPHFPYDVVITRRSPASIDRYRWREDQVSNDDVGSFEAAEDLAMEILARRDEPTIRLRVEAFTDQMHGVSPGSVVSFDYAPSLAVGEFVVLETKDTYQTGKLNTDVVLQKLG